jgi:hypothetical protein
MMTTDIRLPQRGRSAPGQFVLGPPRESRAGGNHVGGDRRSAREPDAIIEAHIRNRPRRRPGVRVSSARASVAP